MNEPLMITIELEQRRLRRAAALLSVLIYSARHCDDSQQFQFDDIAEVIRDLVLSTVDALCLETNHSNSPPVFAHGALETASSGE